MFRPTRKKYTQKLNVNHFVYLHCTLSLGNMYVPEEIEKQRKKVLAKK
jgi:hypothetical protein